jgi:hypothetical protein
VNGLAGKVLKRFVQNPIEVLSRHLPSGIEENNEALIRVAGVLGEIRTRHLLNMNLESLSPSHPAWPH